MGKLLVVLVETTVRETALNLAIKNLRFHFKEQFGSRVLSESRVSV